MVPPTADGAIRSMGPPRSATRIAGERRSSPSTPFLKASTTREGATTGRGSACRWSTGAQMLERRLERLGGLAGDVGDDAGALPVGARDGVAHARLGQQRSDVAADADGRDVVGRARCCLPHDTPSAPALDVVRKTLAGGERALADEHRHRYLLRQRTLREPSGRPPLAGAV